MNPLAAAFFVIVASAILAVPRRFAPVALLIGCCYMTMGQSLKLGPINLPIFRMLLLVGVIRLFARREFANTGRNGIDILMICWAVWLMVASWFHWHLPGSGPQYTSGVVLSVGAVYLLFRNWIRSADEIADFAKMIGIVFLPIAIEMGMEKVTGKNFFSMFGYVNENVLVRDGKLRAQGPFGHAILAGTVGAVCFPLMLGIWRRYKTAALLGGAVCLFMIYASTSSGPIMSLLIAGCAIMLWQARFLVAPIRWAILTTYVIAEIVMERPAYYLISKIDITSGSTGWHRAKLMEAFFTHFNEWVFFGTDYTREWMPHGVAIGPFGNHIDITNYYISWAVLGGLLCMLLVIAMLVAAFRFVGRILKNENLHQEDEFMVWCMGAGLVAHAATSISVAYFDQSMIFFWLNIAVISSMYSSVTSMESEDVIEVEGSPMFYGEEGGGERAYPY